jgi:hypothetical protein
MSTLLLNDGTLAKKNSGVNKCVLRQTVRLTPTENLSTPGFHSSVVSSAMYKRTIDKACQAALIPRTGYYSGCALAWTDQFGAILPTLAIGKMRLINYMCSVCDRPI